jgi:Protein of unknown function (DUF2877)
MASLEISASSISPCAHNWLANSRQPRILHVFDRACNLINERREVLSVVTPQIGNGPFNLVIPIRESFERLSDGDASRQTSEVFFNHLRIESPISILDHQLTLGDLIINTSKANLWPPRPHWEVLHDRRESILNQLTQLPITHYQLPISQLSNSLLSSLADADLSSSITAARPLAGLGAGLTPTGDDFLMGALYATWIIHPLEIASGLAKVIAENAAPLTTSLSAAWLRSAGKGEAGILWHHFFDALISFDPVSIQKSMNKILAVGETSGADAMAGFIGLFLCWAEHCSNLWEYNQT